MSDERRPVDAAIDKIATDGLEAFVRDLAGRVGVNPDDPGMTMPRSLTFIAGDGSQKTVELPEDKA